jgi:histidinol phosphatase-like enzyme
MIYYIDIDDTICKNVEKGNYATAQPIKENIEKFNKLYDEGHTIVYWTSRGKITQIDWRQVTEKQFRQWGVKCHDLRMDKPFYDVWIDDKSLNPNDDIL